MNEPHLASAEFGGFWIRFLAVLVDSAVVFRRDRYGLPQTQLVKRRRHLVATIRIALVDGHGHWAPGAAQIAGELTVIPRELRAAIDDEDDVIGLGHGQADPLVDEFGKFAFLAEGHSAGVGDQKAAVPPASFKLDAVASDPRLVADNRSPAMR